MGQPGQLPRWGCEASLRFAHACVHEMSLHSEPDGMDKALASREVGSVETTAHHCNPTIRAYLLSNKPCGGSFS